MSNNNSPKLSEANFVALFNRMLSKEHFAEAKKACRLSNRGAPGKICQYDVVMGMTYHELMLAGPFSSAVHLLTGIKMSDGSLSERKQVMTPQLFRTMLTHCLQPIADTQSNKEAFYKGFRLVGIDGSSFSISNTPQIKKKKRKTKSRRNRAAFPKIRIAVLYKLVPHNPLAASVGVDDESEMELANSLLSSLRSDYLLLCDRYYGVGKFLQKVISLPAKPPALVRVRKNLKTKLLYTLKDGSRMIEVACSDDTVIKLREIYASVRRRSGKWVKIRLWTNLLDEVAYPAEELVKLYAVRWELELSFKEIKGTLLSSKLLNSHTLHTAELEISSLILAQAIIARIRINIACHYDIPVTRISFEKTVNAFAAVWFALTFMTNERSTDIRKLFDYVVMFASAKRRLRSCPRAVRQPVGSWPRLMRNSQSRGAFQYKILRKVA